MLIYIKLVYNVKKKIPFSTIEKILTVWINNALQTGFIITDNILLTKTLEFTFLFEKKKKMEEARCSFVLLPAELWLHVFSFLAGKEVTLVVSMVCKEWSGIASEETLWRSLFLARWNPSTRDRTDTSAHRE